jgi:hypothetical protein
MQQPTSPMQDSPALSPDNVANPAPFWFATEWNPSYQLCAKSSHHGLHSDLHSMAAVQMALKPIQDKGFFLRDDKWTCFRRNHFQLSLDIELGSPELSVPIGDIGTSSFSSRELYLKQDGKEIRINHLFTTIEAHGCISQCPVKVYQKGNSDGDVPPIDFKPQKRSRITFRRLQFNQSTPTNANRHYADPFFTIKVAVHCIGHDGVTRTLAECLSTNIVVLSGTPGQYKKRKEEDRITKVEKKRQRQTRTQSTLSIDSNPCQSQLLLHPSPDYVSPTHNFHCRSRSSDYPVYATGSNENSLQLANLDIPPFVSNRNSAAISSSTVMNSSPTFFPPYDRAMAMLSATPINPTPMPDLDAFFDQFVKSCQKQRRNSES